LPIINPAKILIIKPSAIGDVVHALPILNLVRRKWPSAKISWLVTPGCAGMIQGHPQLDEVILFDRKRWAGWWRSVRLFKELRAFTRDLRERKFDLVLDLQGLFRSGWLTGKTKAPLRIGFSNAREMAWLFYNQTVPIETMEQHAIERYLKMARAIGCEGEAEFIFAHDDADRERVRRMLEEGSGFTGQGSAAEKSDEATKRRSDEGEEKRDEGEGMKDKTKPPSALSLATINSQLATLSSYAVLAPTTNWETKKWPLRRFAALVLILRERFGLHSVLIGGPDVAEMSSQIPGTINLGGKTSLRELCALIEGAALVVANDSGPMHIAAAMNRPLVTVFGPTNPIRTGPYQRQKSVVRLPIACSPCYSRTCSHQSCLVWLNEEDVVRVAAEQMGLTSLP